jgi:glucokinase
MKTAIGIDIGGTTIKGVLLNEEGGILHRHFIPTNDDDKGLWKENVLQMMQVLTTIQDVAVDVIGLSSPGLANEKNTCIAYLPNRLQGIENLEWEGLFGWPTFILNDAHAALLAEARFGALRGCRHAVLLTLGTGVGGGILINGELYQGEQGMAGHFGHTCLSPHDDERSIVGMPGSLEYALGNYSVQRRSSGRYGSTLEVVEAYKNAEPLATWLWLDMVRKLALTISSIAHSLSPEAVVLAGGITQAGESLLTPLTRFMDLYEWQPNKKRTAIRLAQFTDLSGAIGAAAFAFFKNRKNQP